MTMSTLNVAAQSADAAIEAEQQKLMQIIAEEQAAQRDLDTTHERQQELRHTEQQISNYLATKGRDRAAQEQRIREAKEALNQQAEALIKTMAAFGLEAPQPIAALQQTSPDPLTDAEVTHTERESAYVQQASETGAPAGMTQPFEPVTEIKNGVIAAEHPGGHPAEPQNLSRVRGEQGSGANQTVRTGEQPTVKGRTRR